MISTLAAGNRYPVYKSLGDGIPSERTKSIQNLFDDTSYMK